MFLKPRDKILAVVTGLLLSVTFFMTIFFYVFSDRGSNDASMVAINNMSYEDPEAEQSRKPLDYQKPKDSSALRVATQNPPFADQNAIEETLAEGFYQEDDLRQNLPEGDLPENDPNAAIRLFDLDRSVGLKPPEKKSPLKIVEKEVTEEIPFNTLVEDSPDLAPGETSIIASGAPGERVVLKRLVYDDKGLVSEEILRSRITKTKYDRIMLKGLGEEKADVNTGMGQSSSADTDQVAAAVNDTPPVAEEAPAEEAQAAVAAEAPAEENLEINRPAEPVAMAASANLNFVASGSPDEIVLHNLNLLLNAGVFTPAGTINYSSFSNNGDGSISVNGQTFPFISSESHFTTCYDGVECSIAMGMDPPVNNNTATGVPAQRGLCASNQFPFGTVLFVEGYGFCVVSDRHGTPAHPDLVDLCYDGGESTTSGFQTGNKMVYVIFVP